MSKSKEYTVRAKDGRKYKFTEGKFLVGLTMKGLVDLDSEVLAPGEGELWTSIRDNDKMSEMVGRFKPEVPEKEKKSKSKKGSTRKVNLKNTPSPKSVSRPTPAPQERNDPPTLSASTPSRSAKKEPTTPKPPKKNHPKVSDKPKLPVLRSFERPEFLNTLPMMLSIAPGLGQAYNLTIKRAYLFVLLFLLGLSVTLFKPALGLFVILTLITFSMADALAYASKRNIFVCIFRTKMLPPAIYFFVVGLLLWMTQIFIATDSISSWIESTTPIASTMNFSTGEDLLPADREYSAVMLSAIVSGCILLFFILHSFARKLIWARKKASHFSHVIMVVFLAGLSIGLLSATTQTMEVESSRAVMSSIIRSPLSFADAVVSFIQAIGDEVSVDLSFTDLPIIDEWNPAFDGMAAGLDQSFRAYPKVYQYLLLCSLGGFLLSLFAIVIRTARRIPEYKEWLEMWLSEVRGRTNALKQEFNHLRGARILAWQQKREALVENHSQSMKLAKQTDARIARLEGFVQQVAQQGGAPVVKATSQMGHEDFSPSNPNEDIYSSESDESIYSNCEDEGLGLDEHLDMSKDDPYPESHEPGWKGFVSKVTSKSRDLVTDKILPFASSASSKLISKVKAGSAASKNFTGGLAEKAKAKKNELDENRLLKKATKEAALEEEEKNASLPTEEKENPFTPHTEVPSEVMDKVDDDLSTEKESPLEEMNEGSEKIEGEMDRDELEIEELDDDLEEVVEEEDISGKDKKNKS